MNGEKNRIIPLSSAKPGRQFTLVGITGGMHLRLRLYSMGLMKGVRFKLTGSSPGEGPRVLAIGNRRLMLGYGLCSRVMVRED